MEERQTNALPVTRQADYPEWYQEVIKASDLAENSPVRGCMVIKPWGYGLWENIVRELDDLFKQTGVKNAYFPLFIPLSFLQKEAEHVKGFAKECAVVTHHRLEQGPDGKLVPAGPLAEALIVRPTSETIIGESFSRWVHSYRDLPIVINQWSNVVRWEMRTRMFLRTSEFLWQEGHTAHATEAEAVDRTNLMLAVYAKLAEEYLAIPVFRGRKTPSERFPGAADTLCLEAMMQDRKALQIATSHFLGQNFAKASGIKFQSAEEKEEYAWTTSWGASTRLIGGLIMVHADDDGLVLPPRVASAHVVLMPIIKKEKDRERVQQFTDRLAGQLRSLTYCRRNVTVEVDDRQVSGKSWDWVRKGVPIRVEIGPREVDQDAVFVGRRDRSPKERNTIPRDRFLDEVPLILDEIHAGLYARALAYRDEYTRAINDRKEFYDFFTEKAPGSIHGGFARSHWCGSEKCEEQIKTDLAVTIRCIPFDMEPSEGKCICCGAKSDQVVIYAKAY
jgi:prolyl-tRNA synthetase